MLTLIQNTQLYSPAYIGKQDILIADKRIAAIQDKIELPHTTPSLSVIDASGKIAIPGLIDSHVHLIGGGGEGGYRTRTPELQLTDATLHGVTTLVGVIGTDGTTRTMPDLIAKATALEEEGITCYVHTGSYQIPIRTVTGRVEDDLILIEKIIGVGEVAISDHRSSQPTVEELAKLAAAARVGGMLSGKAGIVNVHIGDSTDTLHILEKIVEQTDIPIRQFYPTHINRNPYLFEAGIAFAKKGGYVDFTTSTIPKFIEEGEIRSSKALKIMLQEDVPIEQITFSSDGQASLPDFDAQGELIGLKIGKVSSLFEAFRESVLVEKIPLELALQTVTSNPAHILKLQSKGRLAEGKDADLVLIDNTTLEIDTVLALGKVIVSEGKAIIKGTFE